MIINIYLIKRHKIKNIPTESPSSQNRFPLATPDTVGTTSNINGFPRPRIRLGPGICIGIIKPPRT